MDRINRTLDVLSQLGFIVACFALSAYVLVRVTGAWGPSQPTAEENAPYRIGDTLRSFDEASFRSAATVVLFVRSTCAFCTNSMPFYRRIAQRRVDGGSLRLIAASSEPAVALDQYLSTHKLDVDQQVQFQSAAYPVRGTPTLVLVDQAGVVAGSWVGQLSSSQEDDFMHRLDRRLKGRIPPMSSRAESP